MGECLIIYAQTCCALDLYQLIEQRALMEQMVSSASRGYCVSFNLYAKVTDCFFSSFFGESTASERLV